MKVTRVKRYSRPRFPTKQILEEHPEMLRIVPVRWRKNPVVLTALAGLCVLMMSCKPPTAVFSVKTAGTAPLFKHGEARGTFGCIAVNPPIFLSEDEARQVVIEEAGKAGINFQPDVKTIEEIPVVVKNRRVQYDGENEPEKKNINLLLDGCEQKRGIAFEVVSSKDLRDLEMYELSSSTVYSEDLEQCASEIREGLVKKKPGLTTGVFYCPGNAYPEGWYNSLPGDNKDWDAYRDKLRAEVSAKSKDQLRMQVKDFIKWLKAEGVI